MPINYLNRFIAQGRYWSRLVSRRVIGSIYQRKAGTNGTYGVSFPRSGRHWMTIMLELYHGGPVFSDYFRDEHADQVYFNSWLADDDLTFSGKRVLYLYRNPLDVMYSFHIYHATYDPTIFETRHFKSDDPDITHVEARIKNWMKMWEQARY